MLTFDHVTYRYHSMNGETVALEDLSFSIAPKEFIAIVGPSGCGKTTLLSLAAGLFKPTNGTVRFEGNTFGYMLQRDELFPWRTIEKNILLPLEIRKKVTREDHEKIEALSKKYGLGEFLKRFPDQLSGGMRQRAALIRTLATDPDLLLLDEPFSALDYQTRLSVCDDVYKIIKSEGKTALLVTHDLSEAISLADRIFVLSKRPARLVAVHESAFPSLSPLERRNDKQFSTVFETVWKELDL